MRPTGVSRVLALDADCFEQQIGTLMTKARVLAAALDGRVIGAAGAEICRAVHPAEASCYGDVAIAVSPDTIRMLGESRAKIALVPEGAQFPDQQFQTVIVMRGSRSSLPQITHVFRHRPDVQAGVHPSAVVAPDAVIGEGATRCLGSCGRRRLRWNQRPRGRCVRRILSSAACRGDGELKLMRRMRRLMARLAEVKSGIVVGV
jgi:hypothetical protein